MVPESCCRFRKARQFATRGYRYGQRSVIAEQGNAVESGRWLIRAVIELLQTQDKGEAERDIINLVLAYQQAAAKDKQKLEEMWEEAGLGSFPANPADDTDRLLHHLSLIHI